MDGNKFPSGTVMEMASEADKMKLDPEDMDEVHDIENHVDAGNVHVTMITKLPGSISLGFVEALRNRVMSERENPLTHEPNAQGNVRSQHFEEGPTYMAVEPVINDREVLFPSSVYLMNFYDINQQPVCSRMHKHTGLRLIFISTGPDSTVNISSLSPIVVHDTDIKPMSDAMPGLPPGVERQRYTFVVPPNSYVAVQIPVGTSHQFNTFGPNAVLTSVHPEEKVEVNREDMAGLNMMKQTIWLQEAPPPVSECNISGADKPPAGNGNELASCSLKDIAKLLLDENMTSYDMARMIFRTTGERFSNHEVYGVYSELAKSPEANVTLLTEAGFQEKPVSSVLRRVATMGGAGTLLVDASAAPLVYERLKAAANYAHAVQLL